MIKFDQFLKVKEDFTLMHIKTSIIGENTILKLALIWILRIFFFFFF